MSFDPDKCEVIRIKKRKRNPTVFEYILHGKILKLVSCAKYLGITVSQDLSWTKHINQATTKSNFIKRNIQTNSRKLKEIAYKTYVRPLTEYAASIWDPWQKKYIHQLEMILHRALRYIFNDYSYTSSVSSMLSELNLPTLGKRKKTSSLVMLYKIHHNLVKIPLPAPPPPMTFNLP